MDEQPLPFNPDDLAELEARFARVTSDENEGYSVELIMTRAMARDMLENWFAALMGVPEAVAQVFADYAHIMQNVMQAVQADDRGELD